MEEMMRELLASQQNTRSYLQSNNEVVRGIQNAQKEHKKNMDMLNKQLSYLASSMNEICGNAERFPATVHIPDKANVSKVTLWSGTSYKEPQWKESLGESRKTKDKGDILTKRSGPDETEPVVESQINEALKESSRGTTEELDEGVKGEKSSPYRFVQKKKEEEPVDYMSIFGKLEVTIPWLQTVMLPPFGRNIKEFTAGRAREKEKIVIECIASATVHKKLSPKRIDPGWCDLTSSQTLTDQDIEKAIKDFCQKSKLVEATGAHQLTEKKARRKQGLKRASRQIIGRRIEKKKGPTRFLIL